MEREQLQRTWMFQVRINGQIVAQTELENENSTIGVRYGAASLTPEYEAFRRIIQAYTQVNCMRYATPHPAERDIRAAYRDLNIELISNSRSVVTLGQIEITDIRKMCEGSVVIVTVRPSDAGLPQFNSLR